MAKRETASFEELFRQLEETVARLEQGGLPLEEAIAVYERGMELAKRCQELLDQAELKITRLRESFLAEAPASTYEPEPAEPREEWETEP